MKQPSRKFTIIAFVLVFAMLLTLAIGASSWKITSNKAAELESAAPTLDGIISDDEGWSERSLFNTDTVGFFAAENPLTGEANMYFAYTDEGIYLAVDYTDFGGAYTVRYYYPNGNMSYEASYPCEDVSWFKFEPGGYPEETPDGNKIVAHYVNDYAISSFPQTGEGAIWHIFGDNNPLAVAQGNDVVPTTAKTDRHLFGDYYWDGDVFAFAIDLNGKFFDGGYLDNWYEPTQYCFGVTSDGGVKVARTYSAFEASDGEITDLCPGASQMKANGFVFEAMIPWSVLVEDSNALAVKYGADFRFTVNECIEPGATHRAALTLRDMFIDNNTGGLDEYGRYITVCDYLYNGVKGNLSCGDSIACFGLNLKIKYGTSQINIEHE